MCQFVSRILLLSTLFLAVSATEALACSYQAPEPSLKGMPSDGASEVPTDVVPYFARPIDFPLFDEGGKTQSRFTLVSAAGEAVPLEVRPYGNQGAWSGFELVPSRPLSANTAYVLTATWVKAQEERTSELRFTTGAAALAVPPQPPLVSLRHFQRPTSQSSCDGAAYGTCVTLPTDVLVEVVHVDLHGQPDVASLEQDWLLTNLSGHEQGTNYRCLRLRTRAANGTYSEPVDACGTDVEGLAKLGAGDVVCGPGSVTSTDDPEDADDGCSLARSTSAGALNLLLALAALLSRRRSARQLA